MPFPPNPMEQIGPATAPAPAKPMPDFEAFKKKHHKPKEHKRGENVHGRQPKERGK